LLSGGFVFLVKTSVNLEPSGQLRQLPRKTRLAEFLIEDDMAINKNHLDTFLRDRILERDCYICAYCSGDANCVDHVVPWSYSHCDDESNLVASCTDCNLMVSNMIFKSFVEKRLFILRKRKTSKKWKRRTEERVCTECKKPFDEGHKDASHFICKDCYNKGEVDWEGRSIKEISYYMKTKKIQVWKMK